MTWTVGRDEELLANGIEMDDLFWMKNLLDKIYSFCCKHYTKYGYDIVIECWDVEQILKVVGTKPIQLKTAMWKVRQVSSMIADVRADIEATAF